MKQNVTTSMLIEAYKVLQEAAEIKFTIMKDGKPTKILQFTKESDIKPIKYEGEDVTADVKELFKSTMKTKKYGEKEIGDITVVSEYQK